MEKKVIGVNFRVSMVGRGVVNYDSAEQRFALKKFYGDVLNGTAGKSETNYKFAKKAFYADEFKIKISSDCIRRAVFEEDIDCFSSSIMYAEPILANYIASKAAITRGYMFAGKTGTNKETIKKTSCLKITDAIQTNDAKAYIEMTTQGGDKDNGTSIVNKENVGDITYDLMGSIDLKQMSFICTDPFFDRLAVNDDWCVEDGLYDKALKRNFGENYGKKGYFTNENKIFTNRLAESGILLNDEIIVGLTKYLIKAMNKMSIKRAGAFAKVESFEYKLVYNGLDDRFDDENGWVKVNSENEIDALCFEPKHFYVECSAEDITATRKIIEEYKIKGADAKAEEKAKKDAEKAERQRKKQEKENKIEE